MSQCPFSRKALPSRQLGYIGTRRALYSNPNSIASILASSEFYLPLQNTGNGIVDLTLYRGQGPSTFTRATTAYTKLSTGLWTSIASGSARFCYIGNNTTVQTSGGYLSEAAATQLVTPTASIRDMTDISWVKVTMTAAKTATGIDGAANSATTLTATGATATILQTLVAAATSRTYSCWVKRRTGTGTVLLKHGTATLDITSSINSITFTQVQLNDNELNVAYGIQINTSGDAVDIDFNQFEAGSEATSPLDTAGGTRNADVLTYPSAGNISALSGTVYAEVFTNWSTAGANHDVLTSTGRCLFANSGDASTAISMFDGTNTVQKTGLSSTSTAIRKHICSWGNGQSITGDGVIVQTGSFDGDFGIGANIGIGSTNAGASQLNGIIGDIRIWITQQSNSLLQALTL